MPADSVGPQLLGIASSHFNRGKDMSSLHKVDLSLYKIYIQEELSPDWQQTFSEITVKKVTSGTCIEVYCKDMSELHGVICLIFNMGLNLQAVINQGFSLDD